MEIRRTNRLSNQQEDFALTDIVLNLFIFFVIAFGILYTFSEKLTEVDLPEASKKEKASGILISITKENKVYLNEKEIAVISETDPFKPIKELKDELEKQLDNIKWVIIRGDKSLTYSKVEKVINSVLPTGISTVHLAVIKESNK